MTFNIDFNTKNLKFYRFGFVSKKNQTNFENQKKKTYLITLTSCDQQIRIHYSTI